MSGTTEVTDLRTYAHHLTTKWIELDNTIRHSHEMVLPIKKEKELVEEQLINHLNSSGFKRPSLKLGDEVINLVESKRKAGLRVDIVVEALALNGIMNEQQNAILDTIEKIRIEKSKYNLSLVRKKPRTVKRNRTRRRAVVE